MQVRLAEKEQRTNIQEHAHGKFKQARLSDVSWQIESTLDQLVKHCQIEIIDRDAMLEVPLPKKETTFNVLQFS